MVDLVAVDGDDILPYRADSVVVGTGERVTLLLYTGGEVKNYWIRFETTEVKSFHQEPVFPRQALAILHYEGAGQEEPITRPRQCSKLKPCTEINCHFG